jgi:hypothetical protein
MNLKKATEALARPLKFGDAEQIAAHQFLERVSEGIEAVYSFGWDHVESQFDEPELSAIKQVDRYGSVEEYLRANQPAPPLSIPADIEEIERITGSLS